jgi:DNA-binding MarR family transcriptional regulator
MKIIGLSKKQQAIVEINILKKLIEENEHLSQIEIPMLVEVSKERSVEKTKESEKNASANISIQEVGVDLGTKYLNGEKQSQTDQFSNTLISVFDIKGFIEKIKEIMSKIDIKKAFILLDDFSEIDDPDISTFVDTVLMPLNNWSDQFFVFKIAAYPHRYYLGGIDQSKIDKVYLDFYNLHLKKDVKQMESSSIDFTKRLLEKRMNYFSDNEIDFISYFDSKSFKNLSVYRVLFEVSMNAPRILGYILDYCFEDKVNNGRLITISDLYSASQRYYEECIEVFFEKTKASKMAYDDKLSILQQRELLQLIIKELNLAKKHFSETKGFSFASHFYINSNLERFLKTLELNFFITKYLEQSDRDGQKSSIFAINFGLANRENINWGKPEGTEFRKYFINRQFDFNSLITSFLNDSSTIHCSNNTCKYVYEQEELPILEKFGMRCLKCGTENSVIETKVLKKLEAELAEINPDTLLNSSEVDIIYTLRTKPKPLYAKDIAGEVDLTSRSVGQRNKYLDEQKGLINREDTPQGKLYTLSEKAKSLYNLK